MVIKAAAGAFFSGRENKYTIGCFLQFINRKINYLKPGETSSLNRKRYIKSKLLNDLL